VNGPPYNGNADLRAIAPGAPGAADAAFCRGQGRRHQADRGGLQFAAARRRSSSSPWPGTWSPTCHAPSAGCWTRAHHTAPKSRFFDELEAT